MKTCLLFVLFLLAGFVSLQAQDQIYTTDGQIINAHILEIKEHDISYQTYGNPEGPIYYISKNSIQKIIFESGIEETFNHTGQQIDLYGDEKTNSQVTSPDRIYLTDGKVIECEVVEKKRFGISYIPVNTDNNYVEYISNTKVDRIEYSEGEVEYISGNPNNRDRRKDPRDFSYLSPHYVSLNVGPAIPFGAYGSSQGGAGAGFASTGFDVNADVTYYLFRGLGFSATVGYTFNPYNDIAMRSEVLNNVMGQNPTATDINVNVGDWHNFYAMLGVGYYNDFGRLILDYKAMGGFLYTAFPTSVAKFQDSGNSHRVEFKDNSASFLFGGYSGFRYFLTRKWSVRGGITMLFGKGSFAGIKRTEYINGEYQGESVFSGTIEQPISWIMIHAGVCFTLGK